MRNLLAAVGLVALAVGSGPLAAQTIKPQTSITADHYADNRRTVDVRISERVDEADALNIAVAMNSRARHPVTRTHVNFYLAQLPVGQGPWASVIFAPNAAGEIKPKLFVNGLKLEDEIALIAEHRADRRQLVGSWLTSPPAAPGRLTIFRENGQVYAEWRLRNGQRTTDALKSTPSAAGRRFDVVGGGHYVVNRSGELELWSGTTLIAVAEQIRSQPLLAAKPNPSKPGPGAPLPPPPSYPPVAAASPAQRATSAEVREQALPPEATRPESRPANVAQQRRLRDRAKSAASLPKSAPPSAATNGDQIAAKIAGTI